MKKILLIFLLIPIEFYSQESAFQEEELNINQFIDGTLTQPNSINNSPLVIFIQGSGPTDRNGNQSMMKSDFAKKIAHQLADEGIASFRFDKRIFKMNKLKIKEEDLRFEDFVEDVEAIMSYFKGKENFSKIILAGHSEGSLLGILAADQGADALISLAGAGRSIDNIVVDQIGKQAPGLQQNTRESFDELMEKGSTSNYNPALGSIFRPSVQPYMVSWIKYDPAEEIAELEIPVLIVQGTADIQVQTSEAEILHEALPNSELKIIPDMNHVFREIKGNDALVNTKSYNEPNRPLHPDLIPILVEFVKNIEK
ncbi:alpha/beta hydrolase family protein [Salegentibacter sp.]|uniref:alpha/beta hydrolase family protein n=1 Tax=Salegentibacter sp. TaxID=1903072 RepID=UPI003565D6DE